MRYAKFWAALIGAGATSAIVVFGPGSTVGRVAVVLSSVATAATVYAVPNTPPAVTP